MIIYSCLKKFSGFRRKFEKKNEGGQIDHIGMSRVNYSNVWHSVRCLFSILSVNWRNFSHEHLFYKILRISLILWKVWNAVLDGRKRSKRLEANEAKWLRFGETELNPLSHFRYSIQRMCVPPLIAFIRPANNRVDIIFLPVKETRAIQDGGTRTRNMRLQETDWCYFYTPFENDSVFANNYIIVGVFE